MCVCVRKFIYKSADTRRRLRRRGGKSDTLRCTRYRDKCSNFVRRKTSETRHSRPPPPQTSPPPPTVFPLTPSSRLEAGQVKRKSSLR